MNLANKVNFTMDTIKRMEDMSFFIYAQIFDNLLIVAQRETNCFVLKTSEGLVIIDAIWPSKKVYNAVIEAISDIGWNPNDINKLVITHGHVDHTGCGKYFVENHKVKTYLSKTDDVYWQEHPTKPDRPETWKDFSIDCYVNDGDIISCRDENIYVYHTPGHTPGCLSYVFPVYDNGKKHMAALFGGETPPWNSKEGTKEFLRSLNYFTKECEKKQVDVALCNHTIFDNGIEPIRYSAKRYSYMPNIYVLGQDNFLEFCKTFSVLAQDNLKRLENEKG